MRIDTLKTRNRLINEYGVDERQAEGIVEAIASAEGSGCDKSRSTPVGAANRTR